MLERSLSPFILVTLGLPDALSRGWEGLCGASWVRERCRKPCPPAKSEQVHGADGVYKEAPPFMSSLAGAAASHPLRATHLPCCKQAKSHSALGSTAGR